MLPKGEELICSFLSRLKHMKFIPDQPLSTNVYFTPLYEVHACMDLLTNRHFAKAITAWQQLNADIAGLPFVI